MLKSVRDALVALASVLETLQATAWAAGREAAASRSARRLGRAAFEIASESVEVCRPDQVG